MQVFTPTEVAHRAANKYLGVLVAAKFARLLNDMALGGGSSRDKKLTTKALEELTGGTIEYRVVPRRT